jgi:hypothetical protein
MHKAIRLKVTLQIEGEDAPAQDFSKSTIQSVRDILAAGHWRHPQLGVTVKDIVEDDDYDADDAKKGGGDQKPAAPPAAAAT